VTAAERMLSECIEIQKRFLRSVNLEKDYEAGNQNGEYIVTPTARQILLRVSEGLSTASSYRAWTVTGPYGVGKSAFAVFLTRLLCQQGKEKKVAWNQLEQADRALARELARKGHESNGKKGMLPVLLTARRTPATVCLLEGIQSALPQFKRGHARAFAEEIDSLLKIARKGQGIDSRRVTSLLSSLSAFAERAGHSGVLLLIDELGKLFEFAARTPQRGDVFVLQEIAEQASRSGKFPILLLGFLHQSFEEYGQHLDSLTRKEWAKIHGRFEDIAFLEPADQVIRMIASAIKWKSPELPPEQYRYIRRISGACAEHGVCPPGMRKAEFEDVCLRAYPLHPVTLVALPFVFRRFAQNERSLFSYLSSLEPCGFHEFLRTHAISNQEPVFLRLHHLFDYFTINFGAGLFRQPQARRWLEAADVLDRKEDLLPEQVELLKTIGVLGALGDFCHLSAQETMISLSTVDNGKPSKGIYEGLKHLQERSIITHRRYNNTYRIWEGSDVDIEERVSEGERKIRGSISLAESIKRYLEPRPLVARRHSFEVGAPRYFSVEYIDDASAISEREGPPPGAAGQILVCLPSTSAQLETFRQLAMKMSPSRIKLVIAIPQQMGEMNAAVIELAALRWAWDNTPELRDDRVARREIALRIAEAEHFLRRSLNTLLDPRREPWGSECLWYWKGKRQSVRSRVGISHLLSDVCDQVYSETPRIRNELIARRILSSAAAAARRNLIERMMAYPEKPALGIDGYPPERSMYESVLRATRLHSEKVKGAWSFAPPDERSPINLWPAWQHLSDTVFQTEPMPQALDQVFRSLSEPPYGVMDGLHPVLLCAFMMSYPDETTLYREGTFIPEPGIADFEVLMRRPELFAIAGSRVTGARSVVVERLARGLGAQPATVPVVRALFRMVKQLPEFAWRTSRLPVTTIRLRDAFEKAKSPEKFLYSDLPLSLDLAAFSDSMPNAAEVETFFDTLNKSLQDWVSVMPRVLQEAKAALLKSCALEPADAGWERLREIIAKLESRESDPVLLQFYRRVVESSSDEAGVGSVLALVVNRPTANWMDSDVDRFPELASALGDAIQRSMVRAGLGGESSSAVDLLTSDQCEKARSLAREIEEKLASSLLANTPQVIRAALLLLADQVREGAEKKK
jgi:hypothetical protein